MEVVEISREERDVYLIPQNFVDTGTILGGTVKLRNAVEAAVLAVGSAVPLFYLPLAFNIRLMIVIAVSVPLGVFGVVGIGGDSLTQFVAHWFRFMKHRRIVTPTPQGNLEANRHRHLRFISKRYHVVYYEDADALPHNAQVLQRKADRHGKLVKRQTLYDLLPIEKIENGILHTTDDRYIKILEIEPINFLLRSPREQRSVIYSFASLLKVSPVRLQFKSFSRKADVNAYLDKLRLDAANEPDAAVRKRHMSYIRFVKRLGSRDAVSRRFFVIFQYEAPTNERNISYAEIVSTLETTARNFRTYLAQCGNAIVEHENEDEFLTDVFYTLLNRRTAVQVPLQERIQDVLASYLAQNDTTSLDKISWQENGGQLLVVKQYSVPYGTTVADLTESTMQWNGVDYTLWGVTQSVEGGVTEEKEVTQDFELSVRSADAETARNDVKESVAYDDEYGFSGTLTLQDITIGETLQADSTYMATAHYAGTVTRTEAGTVHYTLLYAPISAPVVVAAAESGITPALLITGIACALLFIAVLLIITHLLRKEPTHTAEPAKPAPAPKVYVPSGDIVLGGRNEDDDEENL